MRTGLLYEKDGSLVWVRFGMEGMSWSWNVRWGDAEMSLLFDILIYCRMGC